MSRRRPASASLLALRLRATRAHAQPHPAGGATSPEVPSVCLRTPLGTPVCVDPPGRRRIRPGR